MRGRIRAAVKHAREYDIRHTRDLTLFVFLYHEYGAGFADAEATRWMGSLLRDRHLDSRDKLSLIYARLELAAGPPPS
jgi:hypothetical protein